MKYLKVLLLGAVLSLTVLARGDQNPASFLCDYHNTYFTKQGQEYPNGKCYDVYKHTYCDLEGKRGCMLIHKAVIPCAD